MTPFVSDPDFTLYVGDALDVLRELPDGSVERLEVRASFGETEGRYSNDPGILSASTRGIGKSSQYYRSLGMEGPPPPETVGWSDCGHADYRPGRVLDPFMGSGTTALVARKLGRHAIGIELSPEYAALCARRLQQQSLFAETT